MIFSLEHLQQQLSLLPIARPRRYLVGFSGGLDSHVLLSALIQLDLDVPIIAVHINHSIHAQSDQWQRHCEKVAEDLGIDFLTRKVDANPPVGESPEAWAREKRYAAFSLVIEEGDLLLLAQHQDDQIETFFLQLLRGSGPHGLAAMPMSTNFSNGCLARPLLEVKRQELELYAQEQKLSWIEDPSNEDHRYDRNYLRHEIIPLISKRWPGYASSLSRSISLQLDACKLLNDSAVNDLNSVRCENSLNLSVKNLRKLSDTNLRNLLRYWVNDMGFALPSSKKLKQIINTVLTAAEDRSPCVEWPGVEIRRYRDQLMIMSPKVQHDPAVSYQWDLEHPLELCSGRLTTGFLSVKKSMGKGFYINTDFVDVRFRQGGEALKPAGYTHTITLKKFLQEQGVPPWLRDQIPLIYSENELVAVSDLCIVDQFVVGENCEGMVVSFNWNQKSF